MSTISKFRKKTSKGPSIRFPRLPINFKVLSIQTIQIWAFRGDFLKQNCNNPIKCWTLCLKIIGTFITTLHLQLTVLPTITTIIISLTIWTNHICPNLCCQIWETSKRSWRICLQIRMELWSIIIKIIMVLYEKLDSIIIPNWLCLWRQQALQRHSKRLYTRLCPHLKLARLIWDRQDISILQMWDTCSATLTWKRSSMWTRTKSNRQTTRRYSPWIRSPYPIKRSKNRSLKPKIWTSKYKKFKKTNT